MTNEIKKQLEAVLENGGEGALVIINLREDTSSPFTQMLLRQGWNYQLLAMDIDAIEYYLETGNIEGEEYGEEQSIKQSEKTAESHIGSLKGYAIVK